MLTNLRKFTVIFLAILQLIAPLVHAHVGKNAGLLPNSSPAALHVPGLEKYSVDRDALVSGIKTFHGDIFSHDPSADGMLIGIDTGIKHKPFKADADLDDHHYLHQQTVIFKTAASAIDAPFFPKSQQLVYRLLVPSISPRGPPAQ